MDEFIEIGEPVARSYYYVPIGVRNGGTSMASGVEVQLIGTSYALVRLPSGACHNYPCSGEEFNADFVKEKVRDALRKQASSAVWQSFQPRNPILP
jgi:hypothetical protein